MPTPPPQLLIGDTAGVFPLADASLIQSFALGLMIAGAIIGAWSMRSSIAEVMRRVLKRPETPEASAPYSRPVGGEREERGPTQSESLSSVMADAEELAQLLADRMDRQAARLEQLIAAADDRLARLEKALAQPVPRGPNRQDLTDPMSRQVYDLSDRGLPSVEIARQLNQQTGKVELILALRQHT